MFNNILTCSKVINLATVKAKWEVSGEGAIAGGSYNPYPCTGKWRRLTLFNLEAGEEALGDGDADLGEGHAAWLGLVSLAWQRHPQASDPDLWVEVSGGRISLVLLVLENLQARFKCCPEKALLLLWDTVPQMTPKTTGADKQWNRRNESPASQDPSSNSCWWSVTGRQRAEWKCGLQTSSPGSQSWV